MHWRYSVTRTTRTWMPINASSRYGSCGKTWSGCRKQATIKLRRSQGSRCHHWTTRACSSSQHLQSRDGAPSQKCIASEDLHLVQDERRQFSVTSKLTEVLHSEAYICVTLVLWIKSKNYKNIFYVQIADCRRARMEGIGLGVGTCQQWLVLSLLSCCCIESALPV